MVGSLAEFCRIDREGMGPEALKAPNCATGCAMVVMDEYLDGKYQRQVVYPGP
jgi:hypothetical protein